MGCFRVGNIPIAPYSLNSLSASHGWIALGGVGLLCEVPRSHSDAPHSVKDLSGRVMNPTQAHLPDNIQHLQETDIHALRGI